MNVRKMLQPTTLEKLLHKAASDKMCAIHYTTDILQREERVDLVYRP